MKIVYTAITAGYDKLRPLKYKTPGWQYICFSDVHLEAEGWDVKVMRLLGDRAKWTKKIKILNHIYAPADISIWVDGSMEIIGDMDEFVKEIPIDNLVIPKHPQHSTLSRELEACIALKKDDEKIMTEQVKRYPNMQYDFTQNTVLVRVGDLTKAMNIWWEEVYNWSKRDQLSFGYAMRQAKQTYQTFDWAIVEKYFVWHKLHR